MYSKYLQLKFEWRNKQNHCNNTSKHINASGKQSWYSGIVLILDELSIYLDMSDEEIKSKLIQRSML